MKAKLFVLVVGTLLTIHGAGACEPAETDSHTTAADTVSEGVMATFELTRAALQRQAYLDCIKPELTPARPEIKLKKLEVEFNGGKEAYPRVRNTVARN